MMKKILIFTSVILSFIFVFVYKYNDFDINNVQTTIIETNNIKLVKDAIGQKTSTIKASLNPSNVDGSVSWSLSWKTSNSNNVTDYVSISKSSDTFTCTITFKKAFTTTILLTCTYSENSSVKAVANIDYIGRDIETYYEHNYDFFVDWGKANMTFGKLFDYVEMDLVLGLCETVGGSTSAFIEYYFDDTIDFYISNSCVWQIDHTDSTQRAKTLSTIVGEYRAKYMAPVSTLWNLIYSDSVVGFKVSYDIFYDLYGYDYYMGSGTSIIYFKFPWK